MMRNNTVWADATKGTHVDRELIILNCLSVDISYH